MASHPPDTIHVKRKRGAEHAVDFLQFATPRLERSKRSRLDDGGWVYQRKRPDTVRAGHSDEPSAATIPVIQPTKEGDEDRLLRRAHKPARAPTSTDATTSREASAALAASKQPAPTATIHPIPDRIRRFHLSRSSSPRPGAGVSKKRTAPAVFVERDSKKQRASLKAIIQERNVPPSEPSEPRCEPESSQHPSPANEEPATAKEPRPLTLRRPGRRACTQASGSKPALPPSMRNREDKNLDELAREMDAWTLDEISKGLGKMEEQSSTSKYSPAKSRFKPKAPKQRYFERHPESLASTSSPADKAAQQQPAAATAAAEIDAQSSTDEEDYVLETYERVPADRLRDHEVPAHLIGLLVFDTDPEEIEFFYGLEGDSGDDLDDDDEDSNAEDYYAADYPDEDLDWDDEFNRNPYRYLNQNASDMEEFDERDYDDEALLEELRTWEEKNHGSVMQSLKK